MLRIRRTDIFCAVCIYEYVYIHYILSIGVDLILSTTSIRYAASHVRMLRVLLYDAIHSTLDLYIGGSLSLLPIYVYAVIVIPHHIFSSPHMYLYTPYHHYQIEAIHAPRYIIRFFLACSLVLYFLYVLYIGRVRRVNPRI